MAIYNRTQHKILYDLIKKILLLTWPSVHVFFSLLFKFLFIII